MTTNKCITCQTHEVNPMISKSFCSQLCKSLYLRLDLQWLSPDALKNIALAQHERLSENKNVNN